MLSRVGTIVVVLSVLGAVVGGAVAAWPADAGYADERAVHPPFATFAPGAVGIGDRVGGIGLQADTAVVRFLDQISDGRAVTVDGVSLPDGGFVTIHDATLQDGATFGSIRGTSTYLDRGSHSGVTVELDRPITETQVLIAIPYTDSNGNEQYDFLRSEGDEDRPYRSDSGDVILDDAVVRVDADQEGNLRPEAVLSYTPLEPHPGEVVDFDADGSEDPDGRIVRYDWRIRSSDPSMLVTFDDSDDVLSYLFEEAGEYEVSLTVTDDDGASDTATVTVVVRENIPPTAAFEFTPPDPRPGETVVFDAADSRDVDGRVARYDWRVVRRGENPMLLTFSSENSSTFVSTLGTTRDPSSLVGEVEVSLTVTDDDGAPDTTTTTVVVRENDPPTAAFEFTPTDPAVGDEVRFDGTVSTDDRRVVSYLWDLDGDGEFDESGSRVSGRFDEVGRYPVTLLVTDGEGATDETTLTVDVSRENTPPVAAFDLSPTAPTVSERVTLDGSDSFDPDPDGTVVFYEWTVDGEFVGDGDTPRFFYEFPEPGEYDVTLTVTDDRDAIGRRTEQVIVGEAVRPPTAAFEFFPAVPNVGDAVGFDASGSTDDGEIFAYQWDLDGDGEFESTGPTVERRYRTGGTFAVALLVIDDDGETDTANDTIRINEPPEAVFRIVPTSPRLGDRVTFDASPSTDDRRIVGYAWDFDGDGRADATGRVVSRSAETAGERTVRLTVRDDDNVTGRVTRTFGVLTPVAEPTPSSTPERTSSSTVPPESTASTTPVPTTISEPGSLLGPLFEGVFSSVSPTAAVTGGAVVGLAVAVLYRDQLFELLRNPRLPRPGRPTTGRGGIGSKGSGETPAPEETDDEDDEPNRPPTASIHYTPAEPTVGRPVRFDGLRSVDPDGRVTDYRWSGDGPDHTGAMAVHVFEEDGEHAVTLTVEDDDGATGEETVTVEVEPGEGDLALAEVHPDSPGRDHETLHLEYLVFENVGDGPLDVEGWTVHDAAEEEERVREGEHTYEFDEALELEPEATVTLYTGSKPADGPTVDTEDEHHRYWGRTWPVWNNEGDVVVVKDDEANPVLAARYRLVGDDYVVEPLDHERLEYLFPDVESPSDDDEGGV